MPDAELLTHAAAGDLHKPEVLAAQTRRMLQDGRSPRPGDRVRRQLARLPPLRGAQRRRSRALPRVHQRAAAGDVRGADPFLSSTSPSGIARCSTFSTATTRSSIRSWPRHYGMPEPPAAGRWARVDDAQQYGRGGLLPMAVFLTKNAPGLRTSPVKRGYWVVRRLLGEQIPPPPPNVPELPKDEAKLGDLTLPQMLAQHRADKRCAVCHARFDSVGLVFEGFGPIGERRDEGPGGRPVQTARDVPRRRRRGSGLDGPARRIMRDASGRTISSTTSAASCCLRPGPQPAALGRTAPRRDAQHAAGATATRFGSLVERSSPARSS